MNNMKFHAMALSAMILTVIGVFAFVKIGDQPTLIEEVTQSGPPGRIIEIVHANWGLNCNQVIQMKRRDNLRRGLPVDQLQDMERDNVLAAVTELCQGKVICRFTASPDTLKNDMYPRCTKALEVDYRCFSYDQLRTLSVMDGAQVEIDCSTI